VIKRLKCILAVRILLIVTSILAVLSWAFFAYILFFIPAKVSGHLVVSNLVYFLLSGFLALFFTFTNIFYLLVSFFRQKSRILDSQNILLKAFIKSARRGFLLSFLISGLAVLRVTEFLNPLNGALLIGCVALVEFYYVR